MFLQQYGVSFVFIWALAHNTSSSLFYCFKCEQQAHHSQLTAHAHEVRRTHSRNWFNVWTLADQLYGVWVKTRKINLCLVLIHIPIHAFIYFYIFVDWFVCLFGWLIWYFKYLHNYLWYSDVIFLISYFRLFICSFDTYLDFNLSWYFRHLLLIIILDVYFGIFYIYFFGLGVTPNSRRFDASFFCSNFWFCAGICIFLHVSDGNLSLDVIGCWILWRSKPRAVSNHFSGSAFGKLQF